MAAGTALNYEVETVYSYPDNKISCSIGLKTHVTRIATVTKKLWKIEWATLDHALTRLREVFPGGDGEFTLDGDPDVKKAVRDGVDLVNIEAEGSKRELKED